MSSLILNFSSIDFYQNNRETTHSKILRNLEANMGQTVLNFTTTAPVAVDGDLYVITSPATGLFANRENYFAYFFDSQWEFYPVQTDQIIFLQEDNSQYHFDGSVWLKLKDLTTTPVTTLNITGEINKIYFLNGSTSFTLPVGVNEGDRVTIVDWGGTFGTSNLTVNTTGGNTFESAIATSIVLDAEDSVTEFIYNNNAWRRFLGATVVTFPFNTITSDLDYYVDASTGNDSNDGLTPGTAFLTIQKALDTVENKVILQYNVNIYLNGTFNITDANRIKLKRIRATTGQVFLRGLSAGAAILSAQSGFTQEGNNFSDDGIITLENSTNWVLADLDFSTTNATSTNVVCIKAVTSKFQIFGTVDFIDGSTGGNDCIKLFRSTLFIFEPLGNTTILKFSATNNFVRFAFDLNRSNISIRANCQLEFNASNSIVTGGAFIKGRLHSSVDLNNIGYIGTLQGTGLRYDLDLISNVRRSSDFPGSLTTDSLLNFSELT